ncbi:hypothetical protein BGY98DRAFT_1190675 [Russula aff. rugulosa BPL654]|nr:hypothetical protein BGY98DRAFT_1190675 [Russula aff. rugulosa BPL654]
MQVQFKPNVPLCRHGMRDDCPVRQCSFHNSKPTVLYSSTLKGPTSTTPAMDGHLANLHQFGTHDKFSSEADRFQHASATPSHPAVRDSAASFLSGTSGTDTRVGTGSVNPVDGNGLVQAADQVAIFRGWLKGQMDAQKAKIMAMSEQFSIPVPNLELNPFEPPPLSLMTPSVGNAVAATTNRTMTPQENNKEYVFDERRWCLAHHRPPVCRLLCLYKVCGSLNPGPTSHCARDWVWPALRTRAHATASSPLDQGPIPGTPAVVVPKHPQVTSNAPKKDDMAYKTTPCRHFTLNRGWCLGVTTVASFMIRVRMGPAAGTHVG